MLERLRQLIARLRFDPRKMGLGWSLAAIHFGIVVLVVTGISIFAVGMLRDLADEQGKARVQLAGAIAREDLRRMGEDALSAARILAERPALARLLAEGRFEAVPPLLRRFCEADTIDACGVFEGDTLLAQAGASVPWTRTSSRPTPNRGNASWPSPSCRQFAMLGAVHAGARTARTPGCFIVRLLDADLASHDRQARGTGRAAAQLPHATRPPPVDDFTPLHSAGLADGRSAVMRITPARSVCVELSRVRGDGRGDRSHRNAPACRGHRQLGQPAHPPSGRRPRSCLSLLAVLAGVILGQLVAAPIEALNDSAVRLSRGDFSTSIPPGGPAEVGTLARTMEDMRRNLVDLTGTLRRQEAEARAVLSGIVEGVFAVDKSRTIRYLNPQAAKLLNVDADDAVGRFCGDVLKPCNVNGKRLCDFDCPILHARIDGNAKAIERLQIDERGVRTTVITSSGIADGIQVQVIRDETELEAVRRARDTVLANISHEFRTPLAAQLASIELLREGLATMTHENREELVLSLERGTLRLTQLIDNLLESVRIESGQLAIRKQSVDLAMVAEDARTLIGSLLVQRGQALELNFPEDLPPVGGDVQRLMQVYVNLITNASKSRPRGQHDSRRRECRGRPRDDLGGRRRPRLAAGRRRHHFRAVPTRAGSRARAGRTRPRLVDRQIHRGPP